MSECNGFPDDWHDEVGHAPIFYWYCRNCKTKWKIPKKKTTIKCDCGKILSEKNVEVAVHTFPELRQQKEREGEHK